MALRRLSTCTDWTEFEHIITSEAASKVDMSSLHDALASGVRCISKELSRDKLLEERLVIYMCLYIF